MKKYKYYNISNMKKRFFSILYVFVISLLLLSYNAIQAQTIWYVSKTTDPDPFHCIDYIDDPVTYSSYEAEVVNTLQWALRKINNSTEHSSHIIRFELSSGSQHIIQLNYDLPWIVSHTVSVEGLSWSPETENPKIIIDGNGLDFGLIFADSDGSRIQNLHIKNFAIEGIRIAVSSKVEIFNNVITQCGFAGITLCPGAAGGRMAGTDNSNIYSNWIGTDVFGTTGLGGLYGIHISGATSTEWNIVGGNQPNIIAENIYAGVLVGRHARSNKISKNKIYNNPKAIELNYNSSDYGNYAYPKPIIDAAFEGNSSGRVIGTARPNDIIEVYKCSAEQSANEYLGTVVVNSKGIWKIEKLELNNGEKIAATSTQSNLNNTSELSVLKEVTADDCPPEHFNIIATETFCLGNTVSFSLNIPDNGYTYLWKFGDGTTSDLPNPDHLYLQAGVYDVYVLVSKPGCDSHGTGIKVQCVHNESCCPKDVLISGIDPDLSCVYQSYHVMTNFSQDPTCSFLWEVYDSNNQLVFTSTSPEPDLYFNYVDHYIIVIYMTKDNCPEIIKKIPINIELNFSHCDYGDCVLSTCINLANYTFVCDGYHVCVGDIETIFACENGQGYTYQWEIVLNSQIVYTSTLNQFDYTFTTPGIYTINLLQSKPECPPIESHIKITVGLSQGCCPILDEITIPPVVCADDQPLSFSASYTGYADFAAMALATVDASGHPDQIIFLEQTLQHTAPILQPGHYVLMVAVANMFSLQYPHHLCNYNPHGCLDIKIIYFEVLNGGGCCPESLEISGKTYICTNTPTSFNSNLSNNPSYGFNWDFGDGSAISHSALPIHTFTTPGTYNVSLTITGCSLYDDMQVIVGDFDNCVQCESCLERFTPEPDKKYVLSYWVKEREYNNGVESEILKELVYDGHIAKVTYGGQLLSPIASESKHSDIIDGWQKFENVYKMPNTPGDFQIEFKVVSRNIVYLDDIRIFPFSGNMKTYVYDPITLRLMAVLDENNFATIYEYDEEGVLTRVKKETERGVQTIQEIRKNLKKFTE